MLMHYLNDGIIGYEIGLWAEPFGAGRAQGGTGEEGTPNTPTTTCLNFLRHFKIYFQRFILQEIGVNFGFFPLGVAPQTPQSVLGSDFLRVYNWERTTYTGLGRGPYGGCHLGSCPPSGPQFQARGWTSTSFAHCKLTHFIFIIA